MSGKVIITNLAALSAKYGARGVASIRRAVKALTEADAARGLTTSLVDISGKKAADDYRFAAVGASASPKACKIAVDAVYRALCPDYIVLLGAPDVIPHVDLDNPVGGGQDPDRVVPSDLPYACESAYGRNAKDFIGPTRVVGRLPDVNGADDPSYLIALLKVAAAWKARPADQYRKHLGISAAAWKGSTAQSLQRIFGEGAALNLSPPKGPRWTQAELARRSHFINCHGAEVDPRYYGQKGNSYPVAHDAAWIEGKIAEGTVAAAECCYGAQLYDPEPLPGKRIGISSTYLGCGAYAFFGSSTIAYGPAEGNGCADIICQYFLQRALAGTSTGRAALEARQQFAQGAASLDPFDLKTLAQMNLLGDPSIQPVDKAKARVVTSAKALRGLKPGTADILAARAERRRQLYTRGLSIARSQAVALRDAKARPGADAGKTLRRLAKELEAGGAAILSYGVRSPIPMIRPLAKGAAGPSRKAPGKERIHVILSSHPQSKGETRSILAVVAKEEGGRIVSYRRLLSR